MSQNNGNSELAGFAIIIAVMGMMALFLYAVFVFAAIVLTLVFLFAWNSPLRIGKFILTPDEARGFIGRGVIGAFLLPLFGVFVEVFFNIHLGAELLPHLIIGGYALGSLGIAIMEDEIGEAGGSSMTVLPPEQIAPPQLPQSPAQSAQPFRFASWNDEDGR